MKKRLLTALVGIPLLLLVAIYSHTVIMPAVVALCCLVGVYEMLGCIGCRRMLSVSVPSVLMAGAYPILVYILGVKLENASNYLTSAAAIAFLYIFYILCVAVLSKGKKDIAEMCIAAVSTVYITVGFASLVFLRGIGLEGLKDYGLCLFVLVFVGAWVPDGAGYFGGRALGKHKLIPDVSPKKTVEGAIFGVAFGPISFAAAGLVLDLCGFGSPNYISLCIAGFLIAVISIFGDLIASLIKRKYDIKDYGNLFPGHGGVMDRFDSIIAISPIMMILCSNPELFRLFN